MLVSVSQLNQAQLTAFVATASSGAALSGNILAYANGSGTFGPNVVYTYGDQVITGRKRFYLSPDIPYYDGSGRAPSALYVQTQDLAVSGVLNGYINSLSGFVIGASGALSIVRVTGSNPISSANLAGLGGTLVIYSGGQIFISGAAGGGGGGSSLSVTGSAEISAPNLTGAGSVSVSYDGTYVLVSGSVVAAGTPNVVTTTGDETIGGFKQFIGSPFVPAPSQPSGAANMFSVTGASGALAARDLVISGVLQTAINTVNSTIIYTGSFINSGVITGNFNIASFFIDPVITGLNIVESFIGGMGYYFTGAAFSCRTSGFGPVNGGIMSGKLYQVDSNNTEQTLYTFTFNSGIIYSGSPGFNLYVTGRNRIGLTLTNSLSGIQKLCVGVFGGSYV